MTESMKYTACIKKILRKALYGNMDFFKTQNY